MMERLLRHPTWLKVFSVALALLLWQIVIRENNVRETDVKEVALQVIDHPEYQVAEGPRDHERFVTVRVEGTRFLLSRLEDDQLRAVVDYRKVEEPGRQQELEVQVSGPSDLKGLVYTASPRTVTVQLVKTVEALIPVFISSPSTVVLTRDNREWVYTATPEAEKIKLVGPSHLLSAVRVAQVTLDAGDLVPGTEELVKTVVPLNAENKPVDLPEQRIRILLQWTEQPPGKTFAVKPVTKGDLPPGYTLVSIGTQPESVQVRAATLGGRLPDQAVVETEPIDLTGKNKSFTGTVRLNPPAGTTVTTYTVNFTVNISEIISDRVLKGMPLEVRGKASNAVVTPAVTDVQVTVRGLYSVLNALGPAKVTVFVDVEGLGSGRHTLPVKVEVPQDVAVDSTDPATVEVTIVTP
ncbi:MAG TPA: CdaR family protein [Symbiobacteriaceae bacterium]|nr:CdaR family protein [Symbiobacteriaceae bacterium]